MGIDLETKASLLIVLWLIDKIIMFAIIHWEMRRRRNDYKPTQT
jgi:hypothetical protein